MAKAKKRKPRKAAARAAAPAPRRVLSPDAERRGILKILLLLALIALTAFLYYFTNSLYPYSFLFFYGAALALGFGYVLANRCFSRHGVTAADLPPTMSEEEKRTYLAERDRRKRQSAPMLYVLIPLLLVIGFDLIYVLQGERVAAFFRKLK